MDKKKSNSNVVKFNRWGYIFLIPFFVTYVIFSLIPLCSTIYNSFFENYRSGLKQIGPNFVGINNYINLLSSPEIWKYLVNTLIMWVGGFIPQITIALLLAYWFSDPSLRLKGQRFFKTVIYMPNLIMASAFSMLFFALFSDSGPVNQILLSLGFIKEPFKFFQYVIASRVLVMLMNFLMWFGNTTILLMAGMLGIDSSLYEAAQVDGATASQVFFKITMPILRPIFTYVLITSLIGGLQMFDVPQILTNGRGNPTDSLTTVIMLLNRYLTSKDVGRGGALSVFLFIVTGILSLVVFRMNSSKDKD
ncbi:carbohydrate ABC transporter permease [Butyrivibrio sp.]|jgi:multiple sugar transport system permease protein|uniref:carbohydrate ABC transporter permease n=1 Tax=Butyrivibrio sp. TaxID=28121 RepID=UPI0025B8A099|nr:sugar ABC transporter permease [Butyrivibrio sp.]MBE5836943.1 sugar ABC transporter permease [Butyrivibrio sp.]